MMNALQHHPAIAKLKVFLLVVMIAGLAFIYGVKPAAAVACSPTTCTQTVETIGNIEWTTPGVGPGAGTFPRLGFQILTEATAMKVWMVQIFWEDNILPALMLMANQLTAVAMKQTQIIGTFIDAKHQLETQQVFQRLSARTSKDYQPSIGMCQFGTGAKSLAASERQGELNGIMLSARSQDRSLGAANTAAATGEDGDKESRIRQFRLKFCDPRDNNNGLSFMCDHDGKFGEGDVGAAKHERKNKDIDYVRTMDAPWTINMDFTTTTKDPITDKVPATDLTDNEEEVIALANNLYGPNVFARPPNLPKELKDDEQTNALQRYYMDARSVLAKRSVAENSFNAIAAMKSAGAPGSRDYMLGILQQFLPSEAVNKEARDKAIADFTKMLGPNPSYYAQMEILTKKLFQNPDFFTNLYDTPANVDRKGVAIQAIGLMQKFDLYKSNLRNEASLSVLLELSVLDLQDKVESDFKKPKGTDTPAKYIPW